MGGENEIENSGPKEANHEESHISGDSDDEEWVPLKKAEKKRN